MLDYKEMYETLFRAMTKAITTLQEAQQATEEMYIESQDPVFIALPNKENLEDPPQ